MTDATDDAKAELTAALAARAGDPATSPEEAATQITSLRDSLQRDLDALRGRVPDPSELPGQTKQVGAAVGAGVLALGAGTLALRKRAARRNEEAAVRQQAVALAREIARLEMEPDDLVDDRSSGWLGRVVAVVVSLAGIAAAALAVRQRLAGDDDQWDEPA